MTFRTGNFDILNDNNEPNHSNVPSGTLWAPDLDTWRIATASGVRELRTGHGIIQVFRTADAGAQTFTTAWTDVNYDMTGIIDDAYYSFTNGTSLITVQHPGIYRVSYAQSMGLSTGTSRTCVRTRAELDGVSIPQSITHSYHRTTGGEFDSATSSFFIQVTGPGLQVSVASQRIQGTSTVDFVVGCSCAIERISPLRHPFESGAGD